MALFAKYDGMDGESKDANHERWIEILALDWGAHKPEGDKNGRRRGRPVVEDLLLTMEYDKAAPKLQEKCLKRASIPKLEIELTATYGGARATYLKYELKNVLVTSYQTYAEGNDGNPPTVVVENSFEEIKVTYTEYDETGSSLGNVETQYKAKKRK